MSDDLIAYWRGLRLGDHLPHLPTCSLAAAKDPETVAASSANAATVVEQGPGLHYRVTVPLRLRLGADGSAETNRAFLQRVQTFHRNLYTARSRAADAAGNLVTSGILAVIENEADDVATLSAGVSAGATALPTSAGLRASVAAGSLLYLAGGGKEELVAVTDVIPANQAALTPLVPLVNAYPAGAVIARVLYAYRAARVVGEASFDGGTERAFSAAEASLEFITVEHPEFFAS